MQEERENHPQEDDVKLGNIRRLAIQLARHQTKLFSDYWFPIERSMTTCDAITNFESAAYSIFLFVDMDRADLVAMTSNCIEDHLIRMVEDLEVFYDRAFKMPLKTRVPDQKYQEMKRTREETLSQIESLRALVESL